MQRHFTAVITVLLIWVLLGVATTDALSCIAAPETIGSFNRESTVYKSGYNGEYWESRYVRPQDQSVFLLRQYTAELNYSLASPIESFELDGTTIWHYSYPMNISEENRTIRIQIYLYYWDRRLLSGTRVVTANLLDNGALIAEEGRSSRDQLKQIPDFSPDYFAASTGLIYAWRLYNYREQKRRGLCRRPRLLRC